MKALETLVDGLFDYAGMFPPAALDFDTMLQEAARFPDHLQRPGLVGNDLVLTPDVLDVLDQATLDAAGFEHDRLCRICVVGVEASQATALARRVLHFNRDRHGEPTPQHITSLEVHTSDPGVALGPLREARDLLGHTVRLYLEPKWTDLEWRRRLQEVLEVLDTLNRAGAAVGLKLRCAGPNEVTPRTLAQVLRAAAIRRLPVKLTQGLHHPLPGEAQHGFVNVAVANRLAAILGEADLLALLRETELDALDFTFGVRWGDFQLPLNQLMAAQRSVPFAIGSCSLGEPDAELVDLFGALPK